MRGNGPRHANCYKISKPKSKSLCQVSFYIFSAKVTYFATRGAFLSGLWRATDMMKLGGCGCTGGGRQAHEDVDQLLPLPVARDSGAAEHDLPESLGFNVFKFNVGFLTRPLRRGPRPKILLYIHHDCQPRVAQKKFLVSTDMYCVLAISGWKISIGKERVEYSHTINVSD